MPVTVDALATHKRLPTEWLRTEMGLLDMGDRSVGIPYRDVFGKQICIKRRTDLVAKKGSWWPAGRDPEAYGQWLLGPARRYGELHVCEGESNTWVLHFHGEPVIGLPGAALASRTLFARHLEGVEQIWLHQDPDIAGERFVLGVLRALSLARYNGDVNVVAMPAGVKDVADLHAANLVGISFDLALRECVWASGRLSPALWATPAMLRSALAEALRDPSPWFRDRLVEIVAPEVAVMVREYLKGR